MKEQARQGADHRGSLDIGQTVEPVEKTLNGLTDSPKEPLIEAASKHVKQSKLTAKPKV